MTSARLLRYATWLTNFDYKIRHKSAEENLNADFLSRAPISDSVSQVEHSIDDEVRLISNEVIYKISNYALNYKTLAEETARDTVLSKLYSDLINGDNWDSEYYLHNGVIFKGQRVVIPMTLQQAVLQELHHTHIGIVKMKQLARQYVYWKNIDKDIEHLVKACQDCVQIRKNPPKAPLHSWDEPSENFERVHIDYAGPYDNYYFLILVDAKSRWLEVRFSKTAPTTDSTLQYLQDIFSVHGLPAVLVSDNASIFKSETFVKFCTEQGILQKFIAPGHPATNGIAERNVQTFKQKLKAMSNSELPIHRKVQEILLRYRSTPLACGKSPSELYLKRRLRIKLDLLKPPLKSYTTTSAQSVRQLSVGDRVQARWYPASGKPTWRLGTVIQKFGKLHYSIKLDGDGYCLKRHINQLMRVSIKNPKPKKVTFSPFLPVTVTLPDEDQIIQAPPEVHPEPSQLLPEPQSILRRSGRERKPPRRLQDYEL